MLLQCPLKVGIFQLFAFVSSIAAPLCELMLGSAFQSHFLITVVFHLVISLPLCASAFHLSTFSHSRNFMETNYIFAGNAAFNGLILNLFQTWGNREANLPFNGENVSSKCIRLLIYPLTNLIHRRESAEVCGAWLKFTSHLSHFSTILFSFLFKFIFALNLKLFRFSFSSSPNLHLNFRLIHFARSFSSALTLRQLFRTIFSFSFCLFLSHHFTRALSFVIINFLPHDSQASISN